MYNFLYFNLCIIYVFNIRINLLHLVRSDHLQVSAVLLSSSAPPMVVFPEWQIRSLTWLYVHLHHVGIWEKHGRQKYVIYH